MQTYDAILSRRSIRSYQDKPVLKEEILKIIYAGMCAPSAGNIQPWQFIVVTNRNILNQITLISPFVSMLKQAPAAIIVCGDTILEKNHEYWMQACSAATENMLLAAFDMGIGAVWTPLHLKETRMQQLRELLNVPQNVVPFTLIPLGYSAEHLLSSNRPERFKESRIHYNIW